MVSIGNCMDGCLVIPDSYNGKPIVAISDGAFANCNSITVVVIPKSVKHIGNSAFHGCSALTEVVILGAVEIGESAFEDCELLITISLPNSLSVIGANALRGCLLLSSLFIPDGIATVGNGAFSSCTALTTVFVGAADGDTLLEGAFDSVSSVVIEVGHSHMLAERPAEEPTCTEPGCNKHNICSDCGYSTAKYIPELGHTTVIDQGEDACTEDGLTEGSHCDVCGETLVEQEIINYLGHTPVTDPAKDATCTEDGLTEGSHCDVCGEVLVARSVTPAIGHSFKDGFCGGCGEDENTVAWNETVDTSWYNDTDIEFIITTAEQLAGLAALVNEGATFEGIRIKLGASIDLCNKSWTPIGIGWVYAIQLDTEFKGSFDGCGYSISNLSSSQSYSGLFG